MIRNSRGLALAAALAVLTPSVLAQNGSGPASNQGGRTLTRPAQGGSNPTVPRGVVSNQPAVNLIGSPANSPSGPTTGTAGPAGGHNPIAPPPTLGAGGNVCYDNGNTDPNTDSGNEMSQWCEADDFVLAANETITGASVDWFDLNFGNQWDGGITWTIHNDAGGLPGGIVQTGSGIECSTTLIGTTNGWDWWTTDFDFDNSVALNAGTTYWLSLHWAADTDYIRDDVYYAFSNLQQGNLSVEDNMCAGGWLNTTNEDRGFRLLCGGGAGCTVIYDNGNTDPNTDSGNEMSQWCEADDFVLGQNTTLCGAEVDWFDLNFGNQWDGGIKWTIHNDAGGLPGAVFDSGTGIENSTTLIGTTNGWDWWMTDFDFDHTVAVLGGTVYWFSLHWSADTDYIRDDVYFAFSDMQQGNLSVEDNMCAGGWINTTNEDRGYRLKGGGGGNPCVITTYCNPGDGNPGNVATISASDCVMANNITVDAAGVPAFQNGYLIVGDGTGIIVNPSPTNVGSLCVVGGTCIGRYNLDVQNSGAGGTYTTNIANSVTGGPGYGLPPACPGVPINAGETWYFQYWHRTTLPDGCGNVIYNNGGTDPNTDSGNEFSQWCQADDFVLAGNMTVGGASVDWFDLNFGGQWDGGIMWSIHNDAGGTPGGVVASGSGSECSTTLIGTTNGWDWWTTDFSFDGGGVALSGGTTYWLSLHWSGDLDYNRDDVYFAFSQLSQGNAGQEDNNCVGGWVNVSAEDRGFRLLDDQGTPGGPADTFSEAICITFQ